MLRSGAHEAAREHLFRALALLGHPFPQTPGALRRGLLRQLLTQAWHRLFPWAGHRRVTDEERRAGEECVWVTEAVGHLTVFADQRELLFNMLLALNVSESIQLTYMMSVCCGVATFVCDQIPLHRLARMYARRTRELAEQADDAYAWGNAGMFLGMHEYTVTGDGKAALADLDRGREELWALGRLRLWGDTTLASVMVLTDMGEIGPAEAQAAEMIACGQQTGDRAIESWGRVHLGWELCLRGAAAEGDAHLAAAIGELTELAQPAQVVDAVGRLALSYLRQGRLEDAQAALDSTRAAIETYAIRGWHMHPFRVADAMVRLERAERAARTDRVAELQAAREACEALRRLAGADVSCAVAAERLQGRYEWLAGRAKKAETWWRKSLATAKRLGARYEGALTELEVGRRLGDPVALERAATAFEAMGAEHDLATTRALRRGVDEESPGLATAR